MSVGLDPEGGSRMLEHLLDCLDQAGVDPRTIDLPTWPCPGDDHRHGCGVAFAWHVRALRWMVAVGEAADDGAPTEPHPGPPPGCYARWSKYCTPSPLTRKR